MISIFIKEVNEFLNSLIAYVVIGVFLIGIGLLMWVFPDTNILDYGYASLEPLFSRPIVLLGPLRGMDALASLSRLSRLRVALHPVHTWRDLIVKGQQQKSPQNIFLKNKLVET